MVRAGGLVSCDIPSMELWADNPTKVIKPLVSKKTVNSILYENNKRDCPKILYLILFNVR